MSSRGEKARAIALAAIMVLSVVGMSTAFAGSAAAQQAGDEITVDNLSDLEKNVTGDATPGDTVIVEEGDYQAVSDIQVKVNNLTVRAATGQNPEIGFDGGHRLRVLADNVTVDGLTLDRENNDTDPLLNTIGDSPTIRNNDLDSGALGGKATGDIVFKNNTITGTNPYDGHPIFIFGFQSVESVVIEENDVSGFADSSDSTGDVLVGTTNDGEIGSLNGDINLENGALSILNNNTGVDSVNVGPAKVTATSPGDTIQDAVDRASQDYTILVEPGTYNESVSIDTANVTLKSTASADETTISADATEGVMIKASDVTVRGFTVTTNLGDTGSHGQHGIRVEPSADVESIVIEDNVIEDISDAFRANGIDVDMRWSSKNVADNVTIKNNVVRNVSTLENQSTATVASGIGANERVNNLTIEDNTISNIGSEYSAGALGIKLTEDGDPSPSVGPENFTIRNNDISSLTVNDNDADPYYDPNALFIGGYPDLGDDHGVTENKFNGGEVHRFSVTEADSLDATSNWWGATNGPNGDFDGNGASVTGAVTVDPLTVDSGSVDITVDFLGTVEDEATSINVSSNADAGFAIEDLGDNADGTLVIDIAGTEYVFEDAIQDGELVETEATNTGPTGIANDAETGETDISIVGNNSTTAVEQAGTVDLVHEVLSADNEGYFLTSMPQSGELYTEDISDEVQYDGSEETFQTFDDSNDAASVHNALFLNADNADARYGFAFDTDRSGSESTSVGSAELSEGWHIVGSNYDISDRDSMNVSEDLNTQFSPDDEFINNIAVQRSTLPGTTLGNDADIGNYEAYYVYVHQEDTRPIVLPEYDPNGGSVV